MWPAPRRDAGSVDRAVSPEAGRAPAVHPSPILGELLAGVDPERRVRVLDLGPASRRNLAQYSLFAGGMRFADLRGLVGERGGAGPEDTAFSPALEALLPLADRAFDIVLVWDLLNYLDAAHATVLVRHLAAVAARGARLHAMIVTGSTLAAAPLGYQIVGPGEVAYGPAVDDVVAAPDLPPAKVERWLEPFRVTRSVVLRHGVRELLAFLDEPSPADGAGPEDEPPGRLR